MSSQIFLINRFNYRLQSVQGFLNSPTSRSAQSPYLLHIQQRGTRAESIENIEIPHYTSVVKRLNKLLGDTDDRVTDTQPRKRN